MELFFLLLISFACYVLSIVGLKIPFVGIISIILSIGVFIPEIATNVLIDNQFRILLVITIISTIIMFIVSYKKR